MKGGRWRDALIPLEAVVSPDLSLRAVGAGHGALAGASLLLLLALLGALALPRLSALLAASLAGNGATLLGAHDAALRTGLGRYILADRMLPPLPYVFGALIAAAVAAPVLAGRGVRAGTVVGVLVAGASPLLVQRLGELAVVWLTPGGDLAAGEIIGLPARFNPGVAGILAAAGTSVGGWRSVAAEAANAVGLWVVLLWGWGLARLDRGPRSAAPRAADACWWCVLAGAAYGAGYAMYAALLPFYLILVMGSP
jgi:hypothetical protein